MPDIDTTFNTFFESFLAIFIIFYNDGWSTILVNHYRVRHGSYSYLYFIVLKLIGGYILLNLFLSILLENYNNATFAERDDNLRDEFKILKEKAKKLS